MKKEYIVKYDALLLDYFINGLKMNRTQAKKELANKVIMVNGVKTKKFDYPLRMGDKLSFSDTERTIEGKKMLPIIYEDNEFIVVNKPAGLLSISTEKEKDNTAYHMVREYVQSINPHSKIFILHRLDEDTSGVLAFCKDIKLRDLLQKKWNDIVTQRCYYAICLGKLEEDNGHIEQLLRINEQGYVYLDYHNKADSKLAITDYQVISKNNEYSLVDINLSTGRKNQIRVAFASMDHPIVGDKKYGKNKAKRLYLHAYKLTFIHPINNKEYCFEIKMPFEFKSLLK